MLKRISSRENTSSEKRLSALLAQRLFCRNASLGEIGETSIRLYLEQRLFWKTSLSEKMLYFLEGRSARESLFVEKRLSWREPSLSEKASCGVTGLCRKSDSLRKTPSSESTFFSEKRLSGQTTLLERKDSWNDGYLIGVIF